MKRGIIWEGLVGICYRDSRGGVHLAAHAQVIGHSSNFQWWLLKRSTDNSYWLAHFDS